MYMPAAFNENRPEVLHTLIRAYPLGCLVSHSDQGLTADHIPMLMLPADATHPQGRLIAHVARANPVWQQQGEVMVVFQGPHAYITPAWYEEKQQSGAVVPTYNYAVVHVHGKLQTVDDKTDFLQILEQLTDHFEAQRSHPWRVSDAPADYIQTLMDMIVGIEIPVQRITGKWKTSQNKSVQNRSNIAAGLREQNDSAAQALAHITEQQLFDV